MTPVPPIRLVFCITELDPGGAERALTQLVLNLDRREWEPHVICLGPHGHFADVLLAANIPVLCLNARGLPSLPRVLSRLTRELRRLRPSLLQTFLFHANFLGRIAARLAGIPVVVSGIRVAEHRSPWFGRLDRWTNWLVKINVCVSQGVADFSARKVGLNPSKLVVIPNSVDFERFEKAQPADLSEFAIPAGSRVFISIGRLERQKGIDVLLDAIELLKPIPDDVHFLIVGEGPDGGRLREHSDRLQLSHRVHFAGRREDVPELLAASSTLILPSRWEGMPNVVLEAMAAGRLVIATNVEGISELVTEGITGLMVPPERPVEMATAINQAMASGEITSKAGTESQAIVLKHFTPQSIADKYSQLYLKLLGSESKTDS